MGGEGVIVILNMMIFFTEIPKVKLRISKLSPPLTYGNDIILEAEIESKPHITTIQWSKDGKVLMPDKKHIFSNKSNDKNPNMKICEVDSKDEGTYSILVTNGLGSQNDELKIKIGGLYTFNTDS